MKHRLLAIFPILIPIISSAQEKGLDERIDEGFKPISDFFSNVIFLMYGMIQTFHLFWFYW